MIRSGVVIVVVVAALVPATNVAALVVLFALAAIGVIHVYLFLGDFVTSRVVRALIALALAAAVPALLAAFRTFPWELLGIGLALGLAWFGVDLLVRWLVPNFKLRGSERPLVDTRVGPLSEPCPNTGKVKFVDEFAADRVVERSWRRHERGEEDRPPLQRSYRCEFCDWWHVTSQPRRS